MKKLLLILFYLPFIGFGQCISGDCNNGYGTYIWDNGDKYIGYSKNNMSHGQGIKTWASGESEGDKYVGEWKDDKRDGQGTYTFADGSKYVGEWKDNKRDGQGTLTWASGEW